MLYFDEICLLKLKISLSDAWDSTFTSSGDSNPNSENSMLLQNLLDKITSGQLDTGMNFETRQTIDDLLTKLSECMPQHDCPIQQLDSQRKLDWSKYTVKWAKNLIKERKSGSKWIDSTTKYVKSKRERAEATDEIRRGLSESQLTAFNHVVNVTNPEGKTCSGHIPSEKNHR